MYPVISSAIAFRVHASGANVIGVAVAVYDPSDRFIGDIPNRSQHLVAQRRRRIDDNCSHASRHEHRRVEAVGYEVEPLSDLFNGVSFVRRNSDPARHIRQRGLTHGRMAHHNR